MTHPSIPEERCTPQLHYANARIYLDEARSWFFMTLSSLSGALAECAMGISHHFHQESDILDARRELEYERIETEGGEQLDG